MLVSWWKGVCLYEFCSQGRCYCTNFIIGQWYMRNKINPNKSTNLIFVFVQAIASMTSSAKMCLVEERTVAFIYAWHCKESKTNIRCRWIWAINDQTHRITLGAWSMPTILIVYLNKVPFCRWRLYCTVIYNNSLLQRPFTLLAYLTRSSLKRI